MESTMHSEMEAVNNENSSLGATACMEPMKLAELYKSICVGLISTVGPV